MVMNEKNLSRLLALGVLSSVVYVAGDVIASVSWRAYSYANQAVSELAALNAPTRPFMLSLFAAYNLLVIVFAVGVWLSAAGKRSTRVASVMLVIYAVVGQVTQMYSPMSGRGTPAASNDVGHIILTSVEVLSIILFIAFGSGARGRSFRIYSIVSIVAIITAGLLTGALSTHMTADVGSTPGAGLMERVNIYGTMLWIALYAVALRRNNAEAASAPASGTRQKVVALVGSAHKGGATYVAVRKLLDNLESFGDVDGEIVVMSDYDVRTCRGCKVCFDYGEESCPLKDDRDALIAKMTSADGVIFASPNYSWQVSGIMKVFLDRIGFVFHRPRFHGKVATAVVVQGIGFGGRIRKYLEFVAGGLGFRVVKGSVMRTLEPMTPKALQQRDETLAEQSLRFHKELLRPKYPEPSLLGLIMFRMSRTGLKLNAPQDKYDWGYYRDQGWFESEYYYPTHLGPLKRAIGAAADWAGAHTSMFRVDKEQQARTA